MKTQVLVISGKLTASFTDAARLSELWNEGSPVVGLSEGAYDVRFVQFYLSFPIIISSYRICLLHLALERQHSNLRPYIILATGANDHVQHLVTGGVCDEVVPDHDGSAIIRGLASGSGSVVTEIMAKAQQSTSEIPRPVTQEAFTEFMAYKGVGAHGRKWWDWWQARGGASEEEFICHARQVALVIAQRLVCADTASSSFSKEEFGALREAVAVQKGIPSEPELFFDGRSAPEPLKKLVHEQLERAVKEVLDRPYRLERVLRLLSPGHTSFHVTEASSDALYPIGFFLPRLALSSAYELARNYYALKCERNMKKNNLMTVRPIFKYRGNASPTEATTAFMIMPFDEGMDSIYRDVIKPAAKRLGIQISRGDDFFTTGEIIEDIWRRLNEATFIVADLTKRNPNVFYELGLAHAIGKPVILLAQNIDDVPFDVRHNRVIVYGTRFDEIGTLKAQLENSIRSLCEELQTSSGLMKPASGE